MSAESDALNAAAAQLYALLQQIKKSNGVLVHGVNAGTTSAISIQPTPAVTAWSDDLFIAVQMPAPSTGTAPTLKVSDLAAIPIEIADFSPIVAGDVRGTAIFKIRNTGGLGGPRATLLFLGPAAFAARLLTYTSGIGVTVKNDRTVNLDFTGLPARAPELGHSIAVMDPNDGPSTAELYRTNLMALRNILVGVPDGMEPASIKAWGRVRSNAVTASQGIAGVSLIGGVYRITLQANVVKTSSYIVLPTWAPVLGGPFGGWATPVEVDQQTTSAFKVAVWQLSLGLPALGTGDFNFIVVEG